MALMMRFNVQTVTPYFQLLNTTMCQHLAALFAMPDPASVQDAFVAGFSLPVICYLTAWGYGVVINWFYDDSKIINDEEY